MGRVSNSIANIFPKLFFSFFVFVSCLEWFLMLILNLMNCFFVNQILTQNYERKIYSKRKNYYSFTKAK